MEDNTLGALVAVVQPFRYIYSLTVSKRRNLRDEKCSYFKSLSSMMLGFGGQNVKCQIEPSWRPNVSSIHSEIHKLTLTHDFTQRGCAWSRPILYKLRYYSIHKKTYVKPYLNPYLSVIITALLFFISPCHRRTFSDLGLINSLHLSTLQTKLNTSLRYDGAIWLDDLPPKTQHVTTANIILRERF